MLRFAIQAGLVPGTTFREKFELLARWGYDGIEVDGRDLLERAGDLRAAADEFPVAITSACGGYTGWLVDPDPQQRARAIEEISQILTAGEVFGIGGLVVPAAYGIGTRNVLPSLQNAYPLDEARSLLVDSLRQVAESAARSGGTLLLEPLNRYEDQVLNTLEEAVSVIDEIGSPNIRLMPDFFHMNIEEADIAASLRRYANVIGHVHVADSNRQLPGRGHTDFVPGFAALKEAGFDGVCAIECRITGDPMESIPAALTFLHQAAGQ